ncbi:MAG TPA: glycogen debranching N-terminal domain-containing protein [Jatrophihabitans sp.]|nr:glycogen debranching N-terminal domain-containing protein [Jatrophihabitans sp.]
MQPYLHDLLAAVGAPGLLLVPPDGQLTGPGVAGGYLADRRVISASVLSLAGAELVAISAGVLGADTVRTVSIARGLGDPGLDPTVQVCRERTAAGDRLRERIEVSSTAGRPVPVTLGLDLACDLADIDQVKRGDQAPALPPAAGPDGLSWHAPDGTTVCVRAQPPPAVTGGRLRWQAELAPGATLRIELDWTVGDDPRPQVVAPVTGSVLGEAACTGRDTRLDRWLRQSLADLRGLELADPSEPSDHFLGAGVPWFFTLFGRDSLIAARMLLPLGTELAAGTLRTLARRQGRRHDLDTAEEPGKILHELRRAAADYGAETHAGQGLRLPPLYYGTVDATPLWILLLHDAWRWGLPAAEVTALLPNLEAALGWLADSGTDASGFLRYSDPSGHGLANQGWKDSHDSIRFADGRLAAPPVALAEVQAYGYAAARAGADLLDAFGRSGGERWRAWADALAERFRQAFWISDPAGDYPAMALAGDGRPADAVASNLGHLLGTGLLSAAEETLVVRRLAGPGLSSGFGLRTLSSAAVGFNPLGYHTGSVWTHDTAIAIGGLAAAAGNGVPGAAEVAADLVEGLLAAADSFGYRVPELHGGHQRTAGRAIPYPASCRPQAWSAASSVAVFAALLGPRPDAPAGVLDFRPLPGPAGLSELDVTGLRFAGEPVRVRRDRAGTIEASPG